MKIIKLSAQNVKRLTAVEITPKGDLVVIGGKNDQGKSSVLDSILYAMGGGDVLPKKPVRKGASKAKIELDLGDLIVRRTFTAAGGTALTVTSKDGTRLTGPQAILDKLRGRLSFDPLEFARAKPAQQAETLRALVGLDFTKLDDEHNRLYADRAVANRRVVQCQAALATMPAGNPEESLELVSVAALLDELRKAGEYNERCAELRSRRNTINARLESKAKEIDRLTLEIERLQKQLSGLQADYEGEKRGYEKAVEDVPKDGDIDTEPIRRAMAEAAETNRRRAEAKKRQDAEKALKEAEAEAAAFNQRMEKNRETKAQCIQQAKFPIPGLTLDDDGVMLDGIPFEQASTSGRLKVSVAIGLALNPTLKVLLIREGNDLDDDNLALVHQMATAAQAQVWLEKVEQGEAASVIIEDGHVQGQAVQAEKDFEPRMPTPLTDPGPPPAPPGKGDWQSPAQAAARATEPPPED